MLIIQIGVPIWKPRLSMGYLPEQWNQVCLHSMEMVAMKLINVDNMQPLCSVVLSTLW